MDGINGRQRNLGTRVDASRGRMPMARWFSFVATALCLALVACGADTTSPSSGPTSAPERAEDIEGSFRLVFELPKTTWRVNEAINGVASLEVGGGVGTDLGGSGGGVFVFDFAEVNGTRRVGGVSTADCAPYRLDPGRPMTSGLKKSGGFSADDPHAAFIQAFLLDPVVRLPAGDWTITAVASFVEGKGCSGASRMLAAPILVHVTP
jgi:hypothetical protein